MTVDTIHCTPVTEDGTHGRGPTWIFCPGPRGPRVFSYATDLIMNFFIESTDEVMAGSGISDIFECCYGHNAVIHMSRQGCDMGASW